MQSLTRKQREILFFLLNKQTDFPDPPTLEQLCEAMGLKSRGSMHHQIKALIDARFIESPERKQRGIRLTEYAKSLTAEIGAETEQEETGLPFIGVIAAGSPIEAVQNTTYIPIPVEIKTDKACYVLKVKGDSMYEAGIFDGDWVIIEQRCHARNGEIVVALIEKNEATLKFIEQYPHETLLIPANPSFETMRYKPQQVEIQGVLVGQMRSYCNHH